MHRAEAQGNVPDEPSTGVCTHMHTLTLSTESLAPRATFKCTHIHCQVLEKTCMKAWCSLLHWSHVPPRVTDLG